MHRYKIQESTLSGYRGKINGKIKRFFEDKVTLADQNNIKSPQKHCVFEDFCVYGYKKDIFSVFAYEFELLQKMKSLLTQG